MYIICIIYTYIYMYYMVREYIRTYICMHIDTPKINVWLSFCKSTPKCIVRSRNGERSSLIAGCLKPIAALGNSPSGCTDNSKSYYSWHISILRFNNVVDSLRGFSSFAKIMVLSYVARNEMRTSHGTIRVNLRISRAICFIHIFPDLYRKCSCI